MGKRSRHIKPGKKRKGVPQKETSVPPERKGSRSGQVSGPALTSTKHRKWFAALPLVAIIVAGSFLLIQNLGNHYLWQDEAETALLARTVLSHGIPLGYDGKNFFSQELGADYGRNYVWRFHPWFPFYLVAGFFRLFGTTTFVARLPFALFGLATIVLTFFFAQSLWKSRRAGFISATLLLLSVPFLILSRQCRYYSSAAFFALAGLYAYLAFIEGRKRSGLFFVISSTFLFHITYVYYPALLATVVIHTSIYHRDRLKRLLLLCLASALINLPWILWASTLLQERVYSKWLLNTDRAWGAAIQNISQFFAFIVPLAMVLTAAALVVTYAASDRSRLGRPPWSNLILLLLFTAITIIGVSITAAAPFFRYLVPVIPVGCLIIALIAESWMKLHIVAGLSVVAIFVYLQPLPNYFYELTHDFDGPIEGIVKYLKEHGKKDDTVAITYGDLPLKFYTGMRVIGGLTGEDLSPAKEADWVIVRKYAISQTDLRVRQYFIQNVPWQHYERIVINYPDTPFQNRESPQEHLYRTATKEDRVVIYKRIK